MITCPECKGKGSVYVSIVKRWIPCRQCKGTKKVNGYQPYKQEKKTTISSKDLRESIESMISTGMYEDTAPCVLTDMILKEVNAYMKKKREETI